MKRNMEKTLGLTFSQKVLLTLVEKGMARETAYDLVQKYAMEAWEKQKPFQDLLGSDPVISSTLTPEELKACFDPAFHLKYVDEIFARAGI